MKWVAAAPLLSQIAVSDLYAKAATPSAEILARMFTPGLG